ncbi:hypothetical protein F3Y22_tig00009942pilonHSYRG00227 [Hibiscus syriacus]|uniref:Uncharacterized protein n=1 Tax=Hibiscus syriacus TaxID=106335 RepID=A0A6A3C694_HIBSY|nr:hypothetical protein F3Y22_tig00009942pilonHSYRG00227 [Hibiscus syriacus]
MIAVSRTDQIDIGTIDRSKRPHCREVLWGYNYWASPCISIVESASMVLVLDIEDSSTRPGASRLSFNLLLEVVDNGTVRKSGQRCEEKGRERLDCEKHDEDAPQGP